MVSRHSPEARQAAARDRQDRPVQLVGRRVRRLRKERRLSLEDLAAAACIPAGDLLRLEKGEFRASLDVLFRILGALDVGGDALLVAAAKESPGDGCSNDIARHDEPAGSGSRRVRTLR
jgi:transcriptional regulator with XRE-family HTH domain